MVNTTINIALYRVMSLFGFQPHTFSFTDTLELAVRSHGEPWRQVTLGHLAYSEFYRNQRALIGRGLSGISAADIIVGEEQLQAPALAMLLNKEKERETNLRFRASIVACSIGMLTGALVTRAYYRSLR